MTMLAPSVRKNQCLGVHTDKIVVLVVVVCLAVVIAGMLIWRYLDSWISLPIL